MKTKFATFLSVMTGLTLSLFSCTKEAPLPSPTSMNEEVTMYCVTSNGDMVPCTELDAYEKNLRLNGPNRTSITYRLYSCTYVYKDGHTCPGTRCEFSHSGTCGAWHLCEPCANCQ